MRNENGVDTVKDPLETEAKKLYEAYNRAGHHLGWEIFQCSLTYETMGPKNRFLWLDVAAISLGLPAPVYQEPQHQPLSIKTPDNWQLEQNQQ